MPAFEGRPVATGPVCIVASRYNELVTTRLLDGALAACREAGLPEARVDVIWVAGAFELPAAAAAAAETGHYVAIVALGAVIRGETAHFDFVAGQAAAGLTQVSVQHAIPVAFGVLTTDTLPQALARAGGDAGNKGHEAAMAALRLADGLRQLREAHGRQA
ncbi:MAG: 6,7-dimethyl-8-ribityllumazine synthase [Gemmatimonadales bacterium]|nr:6,7-dimethyl-8-ribityllumazine synthase [Gemmatimonadales bacterium]